MANARSPSSVTRRPDAMAASFASSYAGVLSFIAVTSEGSFAKAGDRLGIGRSAVSRNVKKLEAQLGIRLFSRTTRSNTLTHEGDIFYRNCHPGVDRIVRAMDDMREQRDGPPRGLIRIGSPVGFGRAVVAPQLRAFQDAFPDIELELILDDRRCDFATNRIDVAFLEGPMEDSQIVARHLVPMHQVVCASPVYARRCGLPTSIADLDSHRIINFRMSSGRTREWDLKRLGQSHRFVPKSSLTFNDADLLLQAVLDGQGIAQLDAYQACTQIRAGRLLACLTEHAPDAGGHYVCYLNRTHLPTRTRVFIDYITARIRALDLKCVGPTTDVLQRAHPGDATIADSSLRPSGRRTTEKSRKPTGGREFSQFSQASLARPE